MVLKKTDYLVVDDRAPTSGQVEEQVPLTHGEGESTKESIFGDVLGEDPWAELANPLQRFEVGCESRLSFSLTRGPDTQHWEFSLRL